MTDPLDDLLDGLKKSGPAVPGEGGWYSPTGDCVFYFAEGVEHRACRVDDLLTVYRAEGDGRIIGVQIKGVKKQLPKHDLLGLMLQRGKIEIVTLLIATRQRKPDPVFMVSDRDRQYSEAISTLGTSISADEFQPA